jgi:hypothetical protein
MVLFGSGHIGQPQRDWRLEPLAMNLSPDHVEGGVSSLASVQLRPALQPDLTPVRVFKLNRFDRGRPGVRLFEGKPRPVFARASSTAIDPRVTIQHPVAA